jgi:hypothetical protein
MVYLNSHRKITHFQKIDQRKWNPENEDINILKQEKFQGFLEKDVI